MKPTEYPHPLSEMLKSTARRFCPKHPPAGLALAAAAALCAAPLHGAAADSPVAETVSTEKSYVERFHAARAILDNLSRADIETLYKFLNRRPAEETVRPMALGAIKTEAANALARQQEYPEGFGTHLAGTWHNERMDRLWRDYALQFLPVCYRRSGDSQEKAEILEALESAVEKREATFAGTALLSLRRLARGADTDAIDPRELAAKAAAIADNEDYSQASRITAFSVAADLDDPTILATARRAADDGTVPPTLRMSAVAVVGRLGDTSDLARIEALLGSADTRLRMSARHALDRLSATP